MTELHRNNVKTPENDCCDSEIGCNLSFFGGNKNTAATFTHAERKYRDISTGRKVGTSGIQIGTVLPKSEQLACLQYNRSRFRIPGLYNKIILSELWPL